MELLSWSQPSLFVHECQYEELHKSQVYYQMSLESVIEREGKGKDEGKWVQKHKIGKQQDRAENLGFESETDLSSNPTLGIYKISISQQVFNL